MTRSRLAARVTWCAYWVLLLQQLLDAALTQAPPVIWVFKLLPLLLFLPGMRRDNLRSYIWLCFVCLGYFAVLVERLFVDPGNALSITGMGAVVVLFISAMMYVRWRARELKSQAGVATDVNEAGDG